MKKKQCKCKITSPCSDCIADFYESHGFDCSESVNRDYTEIEEYDDTPLFCIAANGGRAPSQYHASEEIALEEAKRIASKENKETRVLKLVTIVKPIQKFDIEYFD